MQDYSQKGGIIDIHGGTVTATGGAGGAGIGGGLHGSADNITIKGGTVRAVGGYGAAGIGGDQNGSGGRTVISGGSIVATAGTGGENIGKGMNGEDSGTLTDGNYFVYPAVLTLEGASDGTPLTHFDSNVNYGIEGVKSTGKNYYLYLPAHAEIYGANHANIREYKDGYYSDCGHFNSAYTYRDDQNHVFTCEDCGAEVTEGHSRNAAGDRTANCQEPAYCGVCQHNYGAKDPEVHLFDENGLCTCGATETITVVAGDRQIPAATARQLQAALEEVLLAGETAITVHLPADADAELFATIRGALIRTEDVEAGSIDLTLVGVTAIPAQPENGGDQPIFGLGEDGAVLELKSVSLPDVTEIGAHAFNGCKNLTSLSAPKVQTVGVFAFYATGLSALDLPQAETIGENAFAVCAGLTSVKLPKATSIGNYAFRFDSKLASVALTAEDAISVGTDAFNKISGDAELILHNSKTAEVTDGSFGGAVFKAVRFTCMDGSLDHGFACTAKDGGLAHTKVCGLCGYQYSEAHSLEEGVCIVCGAKCVLQTPPAAKELTYTGQHQALTAGGAAAEGVLLFALGENAEDIPSVWQETVPQATDAGTYYVWYRVDHTDNSADTAPQPIQVMIAPAVPVVAWKTTTASMVFSGEPAVIPVPAVTLQNNETFTGTLTYSYTGDSEGEGLPVNVGTYEITAKFDEQGNYTAATGTNRLSLTIQKAAATVEAIPKQQHFYDTATTNSLDLGAYLPQDRGETHYVLIAVSEDVFDLKSVDTLGDILSYTTLVTPGVASGRIELMAIMENYEDVLLEIPVQLVGVEGVRNARIATEALSSVPDGLAGTAFNTVEKSNPSSSVF